VVTLLGRHFASRVSASILREVNLQELIAYDLTEYRDLVLSLIADPNRRKSLQSRLTTEHLRRTLFNTENYVRRAEDLFQQMVDLYRQGEPPRMLRCRL
jgi:predicted O-linked N-acetylglucosamine transferase (SPINDLY family)